MFVLHSFEKGVIRMKMGSLVAEWDYMSLEIKGLGLNEFYKLKITLNIPIYYLQSGLSETKSVFCVDPSNI